MSSIKDPRITTIIFLQVVCLIVLIIGGILLYDTVRVPASSVVSGTVSETFDVSAPPSVFPVTIGSVTSESPYSFYATGTLMISGEAWYLLYESASGEQAVRLTLLPQSVCVYRQDQPIRCDRENGFVNGVFVRVSGNIGGGGILVGVLSLVE